MWLDEPRDGAARAGELCERHAQLLTPPRGWRLDDRRGGTEAAMESAVEAIPERRAEPVGEIPVEVPVAFPGVLLAQDIACDPGDLEVRAVTFNGNQHFESAELASERVAREEGVERGAKLVSLQHQPASARA